MDNTERDARLAAAASLMGSDTGADLAKLRIFAGTATRFYRPGRRTWNWFFDTEYTAITPPWMHALLIALLLTAVGLFILAAS